MAQLGSKPIGFETMGLVNQNHGSGLSQNHREDGSRNYSILGSRPRFQPLQTSAVEVSLLAVAIRQRDVLNREPQKC